MALRNRRRAGVALCAVAALAFASGGAAALDEGRVLIDFGDFPGGWEVQGAVERTAQIYQVVPPPEGPLLRARVTGAPQRVFKKIAWDPKRYPVVEWRWRVTQWPETGGDLYVYVALDTDLFGIPTIAKYVWSQDLPAGTVTDGGFFRPTELVVRSGAAPAGEWIVQRINALEDFRQLHGRDPKGEAYGIGFLVDPGMEVEIGPVTVRP